MNMHVIEIGDALSYDVRPHLRPHTANPVISSTRSRPMTCRSRPQTCKSRPRTSKLRPKTAFARVRSFCQSMVIYFLLTLCMLGNFACYFVGCVFFLKVTFPKNISGIPSECQTVWIQIRPYVLSGLIWVQTVKFAKVISR